MTETSKKKLDKVRRKAELVQNATKKLYIIWIFLVYIFEAVFYHTRKRAQRATERAT